METSGYIGEPLALKTPVKAITRQTTAANRTSSTYEWPPLRSVLPDLFAFALGLGAAWILRWQTADLVWSLWLSSLVLGYLTIISTIGGYAYLGIKVITHPEFSQKHRLTAFLAGAAAALFFLAFFSFHFCGFHAGHAGFLSLFFPIEGLPRNAFFEAFMNPVRLWKTVFHYMPIAYAGFLIPAIIAERRYVFASFIQSVKEARRVDWDGRENVQQMLQSAKGSEKSMKDPFTRPYLNVIRMHLLIFFFALCHFLKVDSFMVYAVVYSVYFFPWKAFGVGVAET